MNPTVETDEVDVKILHELIKDARTKLKDIAKKVGLSSPAVLARIKRLKDTGVITGTILFSNISLLGYAYPASIEVSLPPIQETQLIDSISKHENINLLSYDVGGNSLLLFVVAKSIKDIDDLKHELKDQLGNRRITVSLWGTPNLSLNLNIEPTRG